MDRGVEPSSRFLLLLTPPRTMQVWIASCVVTGLLLAFVLLLPFASVDTQETAFLLPAYATAVLVIEITTAAVLLAQFSVQPSPPVLIVVGAYLFSGFMMIPWVLSFPDFASLADLTTGLQSMAFLAALRRLGFPLLLLTYVFLKDRREHPNPAELGTRLTQIAATIAICIVAVTFASWVAFRCKAIQPNFMVSTTEVADLWRYVPLAALMIYGALLAALVLRYRSLLDLWLIVVTCTLVLEVLLLFYVAGGTRFSLGWWSGRICGLVSSSIILLALLAETTTIYARLARSIVDERRVRQSRLASMEALSASFAHEINQPLTSISTHAAAGLRWLDREEPDLEETRTALRRIIGDGQRASDVVNGIRSIFKKSARDHVRLDLDTLIKDVFTRHGTTAKGKDVVLHQAVAAHARYAVGNPLQISLVLSNLVSNALDAIQSDDSRLRTIRVETSRENEASLVIAVADTGPGIDAETATRIFEPFYTTKADGMGMGLMFSQYIVEAHGGRIWHGPNQPRGSVLRFTLPADSFA